MTDQNFAIEVTALQDDLYHLAVQCPDGEFTTEAISPFDRTELRDFLSLLSGIQNDTPTFEMQQKTRLFGEKLFTFLIGSHPEIRRAYQTALERAGSYRLFVRISSEKAGRFAALPWEFLHDPDRGFLALSRQTPIIRWKPGLDPRPPAPLIHPMRVLVVIPSPPNYPVLQVGTEWQQLLTSTTHLRESGLLQLDLLERATWSALRRQLRAEDYQIIHYIGYSRFDAATQQGFLALEDDSNISSSRPVSAMELGNEMGPQSTVRLVILNTRQTTSIPDGKAPLAISIQLLQCGIAGVLAALLPLSQKSDAALNTAFYTPLCEGHPVEAALNVARQAVVEQTQSSDWGKLALFLRAPYGHLFRSVRKGV